MTWFDVKLSALQKMFAMSGDNVGSLDKNDIIVRDDVTVPYLAAMPFACNEALSLLYDKRDNITLATPDDYEFQIDETGAELLPLYIASQLYKDEDVGMAAMYRNEFEIGREQFLRSGKSDIAAAKVVRLRD